MSYSIFVDNAAFGGCGSLVEACGKAKQAARSAPGQEVTVEDRDGVEVARYELANGAMKAWAR